MRRTGAGANLSFDATSRNDELKERALVKIQFLQNEANKVEGLHYSGFETFRGSPYKSCARETGQNSRDAATGESPVYVSFRLLEIPRDQIPFADHLQHSIECCLKSPRDADTKAHLKRALARIEAPTVKILEIADFHTTGLTGPVDDENSVFAALVKGDGVTNKADPTSAGSYGIGKNAAYAVSELQTVIYSTCYRDGEQVRFAAQGRLRLISHTDSDKKFSAEGYWGQDSFAPIISTSEVPGWAARDKIGTSIFSVGFHEQEQWGDRMRLSLAANFFLALKRNEIEFMVEDVKLNQHSIESILESTDIADIAAATSDTASLERAKRLLLCVSSDASTHHTITVVGLGDFELHLLIAENMPREIHVLRNGIYISDNFGEFGLPMRAFKGTKEYIAVLEPARTGAGRESSRLLKQLENPSHDKFQPERIVDATAQRTARLQIKDLISQVRGIIKGAAKIDEVDQSDLDELAHLFAAGGTSLEAPENSDEPNPERFKYGEARRSERKRTPAGGGNISVKTRRGNEDDKPERKKAEKTKRERKSPTGVRTIALDHVRSKVSDKTDERRRTIFFTPAAGGEAEIIIAASGLSDDVELTLAGSSVGKVVNGRLRASLLEGQRTEVELTFAEAFAGPIEMHAIGVTTPAQEEAR